MRSAVSETTAWRIAAIMSVVEAGAYIGNEAARYFWDLASYVDALDTANPWRSEKSYPFLYPPFAADLFTLARSHLFELLSIGLRSGDRVVPDDLGTIEHAAAALRLAVVAAAPPDHGVDAEDAFECNKEEDGEDVRKCDLGHEGLLSIRRGWAYSREMRAVYGSGVKLASGPGT
ncbi:MAG: hypothetical protein Q7R30_07770 [Acidobacteriota bacterium]|nr:hypothetical protein [Acidobacteriota bacterium]